MFNFLSRLFGGKGPSLSDLLKDGAVVIDVRTSGEFQRGHVEGSRNIPLQSLSSKLSSLKKQKKVIITCCASGMRSGKAAKIMRQSGLEAHNGGSWQAVEKASQSQDRQ
jgi:rhodanese-related sulfurtransferase